MVEFISHKSLLLVLFYLVASLLQIRTNPKKSERAVMNSYKQYVIFKSQKKLSHTPILFDRILMPSVVYYATDYATDLITKNFLDNKL